MTEQATIIIPYLNYSEIENFIDTFWDLPVLTEEDTGRIGSDLMYQKLWNKCDNDVIIFHADMQPVNSSWYDELCLYANEYSEAGILGSKLIYPAIVEGKKVIQYAGGMFDENHVPTHIGSGLDCFTGRAYKDLVFDEGQFDNVREVSWITFGGCYIRREVINQIGDFDLRYNWSYNRDVDYCLEARKRGWKMYQVPVTIKHFESKDNKRLRIQNPRLNQIETENLKILLEKWKDTEFLTSINKEIK